MQPHAAIVNRYLSLLLPAYLLLLAFTRLGVEALGHRFAPADVLLLVGAGLALAGRVTGNAAPLASWHPALRSLIGFLGLFVGAMSVSALASADPRTGLAALAPYVHALLMTLTFGSVLSRPSRSLSRRLSIAAMFAVALMSIGAVVPAAVAPGWRTLAFDTGYYAYFAKFRFLLENSTQAATLGLANYAIFILLRIGGRVRPGLGDLFMPALSLNVVLLSGSRIATLSLTLLVLCSLGAMLEQARFLPVAARRQESRSAALAVLLAVLVVWVQVGVLRVPSAQRSFSGLHSAAIRVLPFLRDYIGEPDLPFENIEEALRVRGEMGADAWRALLANPWMGVGPGQFRDSLGREVHSTPLGVAVETGALGFLAFLALVWFVARSPNRGGGTVVRRLLVTTVLLSVALPHAYHFLLRERWTWMFVLMLLFIEKNPAEEPLPDEREARL